MFGLFRSEDRLMRRNAAHWLELADQVWLYRRDLMSETGRAELTRRTETLRAAHREKAGAEKLKPMIEQLERMLRSVGGTIYPKGTLAENVEFFLVAGIVILGFQVYFAQAFQIPTNSMWPTYNGMTPQVFAQPADEPGPVVEAARMAAFGAWPRRIDSPADGEILIPVVPTTAGLLPYYRTVPGRSWGVLPAQVREYTLLVGGNPVRIRVPQDFEFDWALYDAFLSDGRRFSPATMADVLQKAAAAHGGEYHAIDGQNVPYVRTGRSAQAGRRLLAFDEMTGDKLIVDRFSYNFIRPAVGSGVVFHTGAIPKIAETNGDQYWVKRLIGVPGDVIEVKDHGLYRNGRPIEGSKTFRWQAERRDPYPGYEAAGLLAPGQTVRVPEGMFFAMGDNSPNSNDGRMWGFIPAAAVAGRPLCVYYPFTARWGPAR